MKFSVQYDLGGQEMLAQERLDRMADYLKLGQSATVKELAQEFGVSEVTIRKDLNELESKGLIEKVFGGAIWLGPEQLIRSEIKPDVKADTRQEDKARLVEAVLENISLGDSLFLDNGTTNRLLVAKCRQYYEVLTIITCDLNIALEATQAPNYRVILLAGELSNLSQTSRDFAEVDRLRAYRVDTAIMGCDSFSKEGVYTTSNEKAALKSSALGIANHRILLATGEKSRRRSLLRYAEMASFDHLYTSQDADLDGLHTISHLEIKIC
ncbi:DeoR/GlpR transcriptional regulator [Aerococcus sanguinicola]|uniref:DeoR/GlpR transcriptional regulator n=2 Tax=Aerococcaceae TaxID=186827 RepID=A0A5N1GJT7_9LACT|nr:DeoR/GlpR transcriptional regulator [Aerococcus sanguinicola]